MVALFGAIQLSHGENLDCYFSEIWNKWYTCRVLSLDNSDDNKNITGYTGTHLRHKTDMDVKMMYVGNTSVTFIPDNIGYLFNLYAFTMRNCKLKKLRAKDFHGMHHVEYLDLGSNRLDDIPANAFNALIKLKLIDLSDNFLEEVRSDLFSNNLKLEVARFFYNKIQFLEPTIFDKATNLVEVDFTDNLCINKKYQERNELDEMRRDMDMHCKSP